MSLTLSLGAPGGCFRAEHTCSEWTCMCLTFLSQQADRNTQGNRKAGGLVITALGGQDGVGVGQGEEGFWAEGAALAGLKDWRSR